MSWYRSWTKTQRNGHTLLWLVCLLIQSIVTVIPDSHQFISCTLEKLFLPVDIRYNLTCKLIDPNKPFDKESLKAVVDSVNTVRKKILEAASFNINNVSKSRYVITVAVIYDSGVCNLFTLKLQLLLFDA